MQPENRIRRLGKRTIAKHAFSRTEPGKRVSRNCLRDIAEQFQKWVKNRCQKWGAHILDASEGRRDDWGKASTFGQSSLSNMQVARLVLFEVNKKSCWEKSLICRGTERWPR
jgi:hypothetical protein